MAYHFSKTTSAPTYTQPDMLSPLFFKWPTWLFQKWMTWMWFILWFVMLKPDSSRQQTTNSISYLERKVTCLPGVCLLGEEHLWDEKKKKKKLWREQSPWKTLVTYLPVSHRPLYENNPVPVWQDPEGMAWSLNKVFAHIQLQTLLCYNAALNFTSRDWLEKNNRGLLSDKKSAKRNFFPFVIETQTRNRSISEELNLQVEPLL